MPGFWLGILMGVVQIHAAGSELCAAHLNRAEGPTLFAQALLHVLDQAGIDQQTTEKILAAAIKHVRIVEAEITPEEIKVRRALFSRDPNQLIVRWPTKQKLDNSKDELLVVKIADVVGRLLERDATRMGVYQQSLKGFVDENVRAITLKIRLLRSAHPKTTLTNPNRVRQIWVSFWSPWGRKVRLNQTIDQLMESGGTPAVNTYLRHFYGPSLGLRYLVRHAKNIGFVLTLGAAVYVAPVAADTWRLMQSENSVSVPTQDQPLVAEILANFKKSDSQMQEELKSRSSESEVRRQFLELFAKEKPLEHP